MTFLWLCACIAGNKTDTSDSATVNDSPIDTGTEDTGTEDTDTEETQVEDTAEEYEDPWPDDEASMDNMLSIVSDGEIISENDTLRSVSAPAGIDACPSISFVLTNRSEAVLDLDDNPNSWMEEDGFYWISTLPSSLSPQESASIEFCFNSVSQAEANIIPITMNIPIVDAPYSLSIEVEVPPPLRMVLVGDNGYTLISDSYGADFSYEYIPEDIGQTMENITWGNGRFLRGSRFGGWTADAYYEYSEDGITWTESTVGSGYWGFDCEYAFSHFLCVRGHGAYFTHSSDGAIFQHEVTSGGIGTFINDIVWTGTHLVGVGREGNRAIATTTESFDPETVIEDETLGILTAVAVGEGLLVAVGGTDAYVISTSADGGVTWTDQLSPGSPYARLQSVFYNNSVWLVGGHNSNDGWLLRSFDGYNFEIITSINSRYMLLGESNGWFVAYQWSSATSEATLYRSQDGETWENVYTFPEEIRPVSMASEKWIAP